MKLYTEEQVIRAIQFGEEYVNSLTPIQLPSDEEIEKEGQWLYNPLERVLWKDGAKWLKEQILNQNK